VQELSRGIPVLALAVDSNSGGDRQGKNNLPHCTKKMGLMHEGCLGVTFSSHWLPFVPQAPISLIGLHENREGAQPPRPLNKGSFCTNFDFLTSFDNCCPIVTLFPTFHHTLSGLFLLSLSPTKSPHSSGGLWPAEDFYPQSGLTGEPSREDVGTLRSTVIQCTEGNGRIPDPSCRTWDKVNLVLLGGMGNISTRP
jgi:hypothetical protein